LLQKIRKNRYIFVLTEKSIKIELIKGQFEDILKHIKISDRIINLINAIIKDIIGGKQKDQAEENKETIKNFRIGYSHRIS
jgi:hypothetical protein